VRNSTLRTRNADLNVRNPACRTRNASLEVLTWICKTQNADLDVRNPTCRTRNAEPNVRNLTCRTRNAELDVRKSASRTWHAALVRSSTCRTLQAKLNTRNYQTTKPLPDTLISTQPERDEQVSATTVLTEPQHASSGPPNRHAEEVSSCGWAGSLDQAITTWPAGLETRGLDWTRPSPKRFRVLSRLSMLTDPWDGPESTPTNPFLEADSYPSALAATVFIVIVLLICAIKTHCCGILQPVLDLAVAAFPGCWSPIVTTTWWPRTGWITLHIGDPLGLENINHYTLAIGFCLFIVLVSWDNTGWIYLVIASLGCPFKDCVPGLPPGQRYVFANCTSRILLSLAWIVICILLVCHWQLPRPPSGSTGHEPIKKNGRPPRFGRMTYLGLVVAGVSALVFLTAVHIELKPTTTVPNLMADVPGRLYRGISADLVPLGFTRREEQRNPAARMTLNEHGHGLEPKISFHPGGTRGSRARTRECVEAASSIVEGITRV
jgi:hypothetical protein